MLVQKLPEFRCDLLSNSYLWSIDNSHEKRQPTSRCVVICSLILIFEVLITAPKLIRCNPMLVVICSLILIFEVLITAKQNCPYLRRSCDLLSNSYLWSIDNSTTGLCSKVFWCCDLLSNSYLWSIDNSTKPLSRWEIWVVICSLILIFEVLITAQLEKLKAAACCDLLSNSYLWSIDNSWINLYAVLGSVVICSLILIFEVLITAKVGRTIRHLWLWFAL